MKDKKLKLSHLFLGIAGLLATEAILLWIFRVVNIEGGIIFLCAMVGTIMTIYIAIKAIEEVKNRLHVLVFLSLIVLEFIIFFSFEYWYLLLVQPASFPTLPLDVLSLFLHSSMVFVFNPLYLPATAAGRALLIINTVGALGLVLFILQNIWQIRSKVSDSSIK
jgi:hypothetical protein